MSFSDAADRAATAAAARAAEAARIADRLPILQAAADRILRSVGLDAAKYLTARGAPKTPLTRLVSSFWASSGYKSVVTGEEWLMFSDAGFYLSANGDWHRGSDPRTQIRGASFRLDGSGESASTRVSGFLENADDLDLMIEMSDLTLWARPGYQADWVQFADWIARQAGRLVEGEPV